MHQPPPRIVLASTSPYRQALLARLQLNFVTRSPQLDESPGVGEDAGTLVRRLAEAKARACIDPGNAELIIGSDQVAVCGTEVLGKAGTPERARAQLRRLSGQRVQFLTGLCLLDSGTDLAEVDCLTFEVQLRQLGSAEIERYIAAEQPYDCAGSFKSEGLGISLFEAMHGDDPSALIGLPLIRLCAMLRNCGLAVP